MFEDRMRDFAQRLRAAGTDLALITDDDAVYYLCGYYDYLHMEFGRPTILAVWADGQSLLITPSLDAAMAEHAARVTRVAAWNDGVGAEWRAELPGALRDAGCVGLEPGHMPPVVRAAVDGLLADRAVSNVTPIIAEMRMIKTPQELQLARHAGQVGMAMMQAGRGAIADGVPEYEVALATSRAGTRKAAEILAAHYDDAMMSPNTHFLQIMASGDQITKTHHRATTRVMRRGEPVFLCFCGMTNFHRFKLGFDRTFWIGEPPSDQVAVYEVAVASQAAALSVLGPGVRAEQVHAAYAAVIQDAGYDFPFRCGRATGFSYLEQPQLVTGETTALQPGMVFAVDGSVATDSFRAQVGDSFIITDSGYEQITHHPKSVSEVSLS
ncbi:peptidase M24 [Candidatus Rhodobacter oscarellae]|uniref:Peptidase M24 n=1 Tax=Candidatus Rhodobacter oscarellae TaxID=1675527 RepID=A0A0J9E999_9RHOB|nr:Xaa-Pro peptidase family protein [Candidatus Rhodobacter lobularis]KMW58244.1 peptidase M24 [Candidatus Rhodobacter lobularis]